MAEPAGDTFNYQPDPGEGSPNRGPENESEPDWKTTNHLTGVRGWLLILCIILTIIAPLNRVNNLVELYESYSKIFEVLPFIHILAQTQIVIEGSAALFCLIAGLSLWSIQVGAVQTCKLCLIYSALSAIAFDLCYFIVRPPNMDAATIAQTVSIHAISSVIYSVFYYLYLLKSKRVKNTYWNYPSDITLKPLIGVVLFPLILTSSLAIRVSLGRAKTLNPAQPSTQSLAPAILPATAPKPSIEEQLANLCQALNGICPIEIDHSTHIVRIEHSAPLEIGVHDPIFSPIEEIPTTFIYRNL